MKRKLIRNFVITLVLVASALVCLNIYWGFNGNPWTKSGVAQELLEYASAKYGKEMVLDQTTFNFKENEYGAIMHPKDDPSARISIVRTKVGPNQYGYRE